jgi:DNA modification methylase
MNVNEEYMYSLVFGDCIEKMKEMESNSIDCIVTDPPYEIGFMNKSFDKTGIAHNIEMWNECLRVLKPGGYLLSFAATRTYHRMVCAIEDAGFEVRDCLMFLFGSGFPKSHNVGLSIDKHYGHSNRGKAIPTASTFQASDIEEKNKLTGNKVEDYVGKTELGKKYSGYGTNLKPAYEPIVMCRKPFKGTVAENVIKYGTGAINIDACRVGEGTGEVKSVQYPNIKGNNYNSQCKDKVEYEIEDKGRFPANIIHDGLEEEWSRYFYCSKASKKDRNEGCEDLEAKEKIFNGKSDFKSPTHEVKGSVGDKFSTLPQRNHHPTVKPTDLMRYLVRMVCPEGGTVLDPFNGSGSTGKAALLEGFKYIGIEMNEEYINISKARLDYVLKNKND